MVARDRGQVLLLGGLAIAIVFLTAIPLSNSLVVSESASSSETVSDIDRTAEREAAVERGVRALLAEVNTSDQDAVNRSLQNFSTYYATVSGQQDGVYVNASVNYGASENEVNETTLARPGPGNGNWQDPLVTSSTLSEFNLTITNVNVPQSSAYMVRIANASETWQLRVYERRGGPTNPVEVQVRPPSGAWTTVNNCDTATPITIDIAAGTCSGGGSFVPVDEELAGPYTVSFPNSGRSTSGEFTFVGAGDFNDDLDPSLASPAVDLTYVGPDASYERTILVDGSA